MNKLYVFCALVFLTACGSPKFDGSWSGVDRSEGYGVLIQGEKVKLIQEGQNSYDCTLDITGSGEANVMCDIGMFIFTLVGDTLTVNALGDTDSTRIRTFVRD